MNGLFAWFDSIFPQFMHPLYLRAVLFMRLILKGTQTEAVGFVLYIII